MPYVDSDISLNAWAAAYQEKHGYPPIIMGREYEYIGGWVTIVECDFHARNESVVIETRFGERTTCERRELSWKAEAVHVEKIT